MESETINVLLQRPTPSQICTNIWEMLSYRRRTVLDEAALAASIDGAKTAKGTTRYEFEISDPVTKRVTLSGVYLYSSRPQENAKLAERIQAEFDSAVNRIVGLRTDLKNVIVVYPFDEETAHRACDSAMKKTLTKYRHLTRQGVHFELFHEMFFAIDLKRHVLIPKHVLMTPAEVQDEIVVRERIDPEKCASISAHDPMARYVGATVGSTVKIVAYRAASVEISYRRCVSEKTIRVSAPPQSAAEAEDEELEDDVREEEQPEADD